jgi:hypothetical protein
MKLPWGLTWTHALIGAVVGAAVTAILSHREDGGGLVGPDPFDGAPVDPYAPQDTQKPDECDPTPKPGVLAFRKWALDRWGERPGSPQNISRDCAIGGQSEHKVGRAWDLMTNSIEHGQSVVDALLAPDPASGEPHALARRAGIMYIIWNHQMWRAYPHAGRPSGDWQPYTGGESAHTDHVHFSFSKAGAAGETSLYPALAKMLPVA